MSQSQRYTEWTQRGGLQAATGTILGAILLPAGWYASGRHVSVSLFALLIPAGALVGYSIGKSIGMLVVQGSGRVTQAFTVPATAGFYASEHSEIDTLEARGDFKGALSAWEALAIAEPGNPWPLVRSAELCARELDDPATAIDRLRLARSLPNVKPELQRYASQKIIDLLLGPLGDKGRAMVELRMLIDKHPESREAKGAREALRSLKAEP
jgi:hypothetical protein